MLVFGGGELCLGRHKHRHEEQAEEAAWERDEPIAFLLRNQRTVPANLIIPRSVRIRSGDDGSTWVVDVHITFSISRFL